MRDEDEDVVRWYAYEHWHIEQGSDWYWALGVVAVCGAIVSILFHDFFFALVIFAAAATIALIARRQPQVMEFTLSEEGLTTHGRLHKYVDMLAFWIGELHDGEPALFLDTTTVLSPNLIVPLGDADVSLVREIMRAYVKEEREMHEPIGHRLLRFFGF